MDKLESAGIHLPPSIFGVWQQAKILRNGRVILCCIGDKMAIVLMVAGGLALVLLIVGIVVSSSDERTLVDDRLNKFLEEEQNNESIKNRKGH